MSQQNPILDYASSPTVATAKFPTSVRLIVLLFILPAVMLPLVVYYKTETPLQTVVWFFPWREWRDWWNGGGGGWSGGWSGYRWHHFVHVASHGLHFLVGIPLVLCHLRLLISGKLSKIEIRVGYIAAAFGMIPVTTAISLTTINLFLGNYRWIYDPILWTTVELLPPAIVIAFGTYAVCRLGKRISHGTRICAYLCISYAAGLLHLSVRTMLHSPQCFEPRYVFYSLKNAWWTCGYVIALVVIVGCLIELTTLAVMAFRRRSSHFSVFREREGHAKA